MKLHHYTLSLMNKGSLQSTVTHAHSFPTLRLARLARELTSLKSLFANSSIDDIARSPLQRATTSILYATLWCSGRKIKLYACVE
jgi:hypothetical protein